ncbi:hypothetical protein DFH07DRAFT_68321, partial [Mycena maculata]
VHDPSGTQVNHPAGPTQYHPRKLCANDTRTLFFTIKSAAVQVAFLMAHHRSHTTAPKQAPSTRLAGATPTLRSKDGTLRSWLGGGETDLIGGTSVSSPTFAAMITLINDQLITAGKPFLLPLILHTLPPTFLFLCSSFKASS